jgi:hypothetical protein
MRRQVADISIRVDHARPLVSGLSVSNQFHIKLLWDQIVMPPSTA